jgi:hypothetical protein
MMLMVEEQPQLSTSLLTRSTPTYWGMPILQLSIGLKPLALWLVGRKGNIPHLPLSASNPNFQPIR